MSKTLTAEIHPRIVSYKVPADTWVLSAMLLGLAFAVRFMGSDQMHMVVDAVLFVLFLVKTLDFAFAFFKPKSLLGGAEIRTAALAVAALLAWLV
jgi:hypothetical protein